MISLTMSETEQALVWAKEATARIMECACSVQIFVSIHDSESGVTRHLSHGAGNWFAREGQVREWVLQNEERSRSEVQDEDD